MNSKRRARSKIRDVEKFTSDLKAKGIDVNEETLRARSKSRTTIATLEKKLDSKAEKELDSDDGDLVSDEEVKASEQNRRGRKKNRDDSDEEMDAAPKKVKLGKRTRSADADIDMDSSDGDEKVPKGVRGSKSKANSRMNSE
jgi:hypothetical protein